MSTTTNTTTMKTRVSALAPELERIRQASFLERPNLATVLAAKMCNLMLEMAERIDELEQHIVNQINDLERLAVVQEGQADA